MHASVLLITATGMAASCCIHPLLLYFLLLLLRSCCASSSPPPPPPPPPLIGSIDAHLNYTAISEFRVINRRVLGDCPIPNPYLKIDVSPDEALPDEVNVTVTVSGVLFPSKLDWIAMITPTDAGVDACPLSSAFYLQTGDLSHLPLLCHYPVKAQFMHNDPNYVGCKIHRCEEYDEEEEEKCLVRTCGGSLAFHVVNVRTQIEFVLFRGGFEAPCVLKRSEPLAFANPSAPLHAHLSPLDSTATSMRLTWVSGDANPQVVQFDGGRSVTSHVTTFTMDDMCSNSVLPSPAKDFGWHDPGYVHTAVMSGLQHSQSYQYRYGSDSIGWSSQTKFKTPPSSGTNELSFLAFGDMGKAPLDQSVEHYIQPGSLSTVAAMMRDVESHQIDSIFHVGDISYATGFLVEWDYFLNLISPLASRIPYMTVIGNHERDYAGSGSIYETPDSGGECGVPYETYFPMPSIAKDRPWYSIEQASVHFTVISTEHSWAKGSIQYEWIKKDLASVDRRKTPWVIFMGHRPLYSSCALGIIPNVDPEFVKAVEPLLLKYKVDLVFVGHVHNYERTCAVYQRKCRGLPFKDKDGMDTYNNNNYTAPVHAVIGAAGFTLEQFPTKVEDWSLARIAEFGYVRVHSTKEELSVQFVNSSTGNIRDQFRFVKGQSAELYSSLTM